MAFISAPNFPPPDRPCPRWGEQDDVDQGRNYRVTDGFSRFRNNFDGCHEVPLESEITQLEGFAYPRPFEVDIGGKIDRPIPNRHVERGQAIDVFPQHDPTRLNEQGQYCLSDTTRESLQDNTGKLYENSRYRILFPGHSQSEDKEIVPLFNVKREWNDCSPKHVTFADFVHSRRDDNTVDEKPSHSEETSPGMMSFAGDCDRNQNFSLLMSSIYNYRLPSALHLPDDHWQEDILPFLQNCEPNVEPEVHNLQAFQRPFVPNKTGAFMHSVKTEIDIDEYEKSNRNLVSSSMVRDTAEPCVGEWENSSVLYKLKLNDKNGTQRRYHSSHAEPLPDLRDNRTYTKRVEFYGYNSSAFRG